MSPIDPAKMKARIADLLAAARSKVLGLFGRQGKGEATGDEQADGPDEEEKSHQDTRSLGAVKPYRRSEGLGGLLVKRGLVSRSQLQEAFAVQKERRRETAGRPMCELYLSSVLIDLEFVGETDLAKLFSVHWQMPIVELSRSKIKDELVDLLPGDLARRFGVFPLDRVGKVLILAVFDPTVEDIMTYIAKRIGYNVKPAIAVRSEVVRFVGEYYAAGTGRRTALAGKRKKARKAKEAAGRAARKPAAKEMGKEPEEAPPDRAEAVEALPVRKDKFTGIAEISLEQQAETWAAAKASSEREARPVDPAIIVLFSKK